MEGLEKVGKSNGFRGRYCRGLNHNTMINIFAKTGSGYKLYSQYSGTNINISLLNFEIKSVMLNIGFTVYSNKMVNVKEGC